MAKRGQDFNLDNANVSYEPVKRSYLLIMLKILTVLVFIVTIFINAASTITSLQIFKIPTGNISDKYQVEITPAGWTFSTWGIIYAWQALWILFAVATLFIKNGDDSQPLYISPVILNQAFYFFFLSNLCFNIAWLFLWAEELFTVSFIILLGLTLSLYMALIVAHRNIFKLQAQVTRQIWIWLYRILVNNGLMFYATWVIIASSLNLAIAFTYDWQKSTPPDQSTSSLVSLSLVALIILVYYVLELTVFEEYLRYTYSQYIQIAIAFSGVLSKNWNSTKATSILSVVILTVAEFMCLIKIIRQIYRLVKNRN